ncbi:MAG TPA: ABC transporter permease [Phycisphaerae bacterium]|nr:ABC transporter permease [Phycisphaerae bacterium]
MAGESIASMTECSKTPWEPAPATARTRRRQAIFRPYRIACAFLKRDARIETSYKFQFAWSFTTVFFTVATFYFISQLVKPGAGAVLRAYKGDYFSFVVVGLAISRYLDASLRGTTTAIRQAMTQGTLELMFASPAHPMVILGFSGVWQILFETVRVVFCLAVAYVGFGFQLSKPNWLAAAAAFGLTVPAFLSVGIMSASLLILLKRGDPLNWFAVGAATLLSGVMFPIELLPSWLQVMAWFIPLTHSLDSFRGALLLGQSVPELWASLLPLLMFSVVMLPVAALVSGAALRRAKRSGSLGTF